MSEQWAHVFRLFLFLVELLLCHTGPIETSTFRSSLLCHYTFFKIGTMFLRAKGFCLYPMLPNNCSPLDKAATTYVGYLNHSQIIMSYKTIPYCQGHTSQPTICCQSYVCQIWSKFTKFQLNLAIIWQNFEKIWQSYPSVCVNLTTIRANLS